MRSTRSRISVRCVVALLLVRRRGAVPISLVGTFVFIFVVRRSVKCALSANGIILGQKFHVVEAARTAGVFPDTVTR